MNVHLLLVVWFGAVQSIGWGTVDPETVGALLVQSALNHWKDVVLYLSVQKRIHVVEPGLRIFVFIVSAPDHDARVVVQPDHLVFHFGFN